MTIAETIEYRGINIEIHYDETPENPWEDWDCQTPIVVCHGRHNDITAHDSGDDLQNPFDRISPTWVSRHWRKLCEILQIDDVEFNDLCKETQADYGGDMGDIRKDEFCNALNDLTPYYYRSGSDYMQALHGIYELMGYTCLHTSIHGPYQRDYGEVLLVSTPEHRARCGNAKKWDETPESLQGAAALCENWVFGMVYCYTIDLGDDDFDSCGSFFGYDHENNGLLGYAQNAIDCHLDRVAKEKAERIAREIQAERPDLDCEVAQ